jgi:acetolactate synthase-1/2/3 large subunit
MKGAEIVARILQAEGTRHLIGFPHSELFDAGAALGIRPIITRTERVAVNIAEGYARTVADDSPAVVTVQYGPGAENAFAGIAQAWNDRTPLLFLPTGYPRGMAEVTPNFEAARNYRHVTKASELVLRGDQLAQRLHHAFWRLRNGGPGPVLLELPVDLLEEEVAETPYQRPRRSRPLADPGEIGAAVDALLAARSPVIMAGHGVLLSGATAELRSFAELLQLPVMTTPNGKSAFPEDHPLALGTAGKSRPGPVDALLAEADLVLAIGTSLTRSLYVTPIPPGKTILQVTIDESDLGKDYPIAAGIVADAKAALAQMIAEAGARAEAAARFAGRGAAAKVATARAAFMQRWQTLLDGDEAPLSPYRMVAELMRATDPARTIVTHDAGHPRDQVLPFYRATVPHGYVGWGKTTQLGSALGLMIGARLARPDRLCVAIMGEAAFGMVGMDLETATRCGLPILVLLLRNGIMGGYGRYMPVATERYAANRLSGDYAAIAAGLGAHTESVAAPAALPGALARAIAAIEGGRPALVEVMTHEEPRLPGIG